MGFLDSIGQRAPESRDARPQGSRPSVQTPPTWTPPPRNDRIHPAALWCAVLFVVGAVAAAGWLAKRNSQSVASPPAEAAADAQPGNEQKETPSDKATAKARSVQPQAAVRRGSGVGRSERRGDTAGEAPTADLSALPAGEPANATDTEDQPIAATADPFAGASIVPLPEDDHVYSTEGAGVVAPRLTSLGFVRRLVSGLRVRTSTIELVVSKSGTVERAKIFSTPSHWEDALILSRAKMFQFVPAYRNGYPVRYRFVMDVDTSP